MTSPPVRVFTVAALKAFRDQYQCLAKGFLGKSSLWLAEDHLVHVKGRGFLSTFVEEYQRFRLSEIQSINIAKTRRTGGIVMLAVSLVITALFGTLVLTVNELSPGVVVGASAFLILALASLGFLLRHLILGPTCVCDLQTRITRERVRPLRRYHQAVEVVRRIEGLVRESQSSVMIPDEADSERLVRLETLRRPDFFQVPGIVPATFAVFLVLGLLALAAAVLESVWLTGIAMLLILAGSLLLAISLIAVVRKPTPQSIRAVLWLLLGLHFVVIGVGTVYYLVASMNNAAYTVGITGPLEAFAGIANEGGIVVFSLVVALMLGEALAGIGGLVLAGKWKGRIAKAGALAATTTVAESPE